MSDAAQVRASTASAGGLALAVLCAQQFIMAYDSATERAGAIHCRRDKRQ